MNLQRDRKLLRELQMVGAVSSEQRELVGLAGRLGALKSKRTARQNWWPRVALAGVAAVVVLTGLTVLAQSSLPGSWLYPAKRASEDVAATVVPSYRATLMMRRADEVERLIAQNANTKTVQSTLRQYQQTAAAYKASDYPAYEHCKHSLEQAQKRANPAEQQLIASVLQHLGDIH